VAPVDRSYSPRTSASQSTVPVSTSTITSSPKRLEELRENYEPYAIAISRHLALARPDWPPEGDVRETCLGVVPHSL
jgi:hypothetical protein